MSLAGRLLGAEGGACERVGTRAAATLVVSAVGVPSGRSRPPPADGATDATARPAGPGRR